MVSYNVELLVPLFKFILLQLKYLLEVLYFDVLWGEPGHNVAHQDPSASYMGFVEGMVDFFQLFFDELLAIIKHPVASEVSALQLLVLLLCWCECNILNVDDYHGSLQIANLELLSMIKSHCFESRFKKVTGLVLNGRLDEGPDVRRQ